MRRLRFLFFPLLLLTACTSGASQSNVPPAAEEIATSAPASTIQPSPTTPMPATEVAATHTASPGEDNSDATTTVEMLTATPESATAEPEVPSSGRTDDGAYYLGRVDAPVTIIDYSDFL